MCKKMSSTFSAINQMADQVEIPLLADCGHACILLMIGSFTTDSGH